MAPNPKDLTDLGGVLNEAGKHRAWVKIGRSLTRGPRRDSRNEADEDLAYARQASSREEMKARIASGIPAPVAACSDVAELAAETHSATDSRSSLITLRLRPIRELGYILRKDIKGSGSNCPTND